VIFVTVGTQLSFDRLIRAVDQWAGQRRRTDVFAQVGPTECKPQHLQVVPFLDAAEFRRSVEQAHAVVAHAGMGSIIMALELGKPIIVMPRRADLGEHRNDHQMATARRFLEQGRITVAFDEPELMEKLDQLDSLQGKDPISTQASPQLIETLRAFLAGEDLMGRLHRRAPEGDRAGLAEAPDLAARR
jgi:UDP-N-acetylglucosamine transferase subunit ALG13